MTNKIIISDTSCLIAFDRISRLELLHKTFPVLITTPEVAAEFGKPLPPWILIYPVQNAARKSELENEVDRGEASAIALALETENSVLIIDERKGRRLAAKLHIHIIGTLKVLLLAKQNRVIESVKNIILEMEKAGFRFSKELVAQALINAGEKAD